MDMTGEYRIAAPRQKVWEGLNDPETLKQCIPGCDEIIKTSDTEMSAKVTAKVGPVKAKFAGDVTLSDINPPESYTISGEGKGGAAGFAKGGAKVALAEDGPDATVLTYEVNAQVGGKLAQIGARLIDGTAKKMADDFFSKFSTLVAAESAPEKGALEEAGDAVKAKAGKAAKAVEEQAKKTEEAAVSAVHKAEDAVAATAHKAEEAAADAVHKAEDAVVATAHKAEEAAEKLAQGAAGPLAASQQALDKVETAVQKVGGSGGISPLFWVLGIVAIILVLVALFN